ncbi:MAG TPA: carbohydrate ABC transporter permease [bacterium]|nr:carbohydrate ABC transporter permease [bacterium]
MSGRPATPRRAGALRLLPVHLVLWAVCAIWLAPTVGLLVSSFRPARDVNATGWWTVFWHPVLTLANYAQVVASDNIGVSFLNSLIITIPATVLPVLVAAYAAHAFSWMTFPGRSIVYACVVALLLVPLQTTFIPVLRLLTALGLTGTFPAVWLAHTGYGLPLAVYLLRNFIGALPKDVIDAAAIDGASATSTFFRVVLPMALPAVVSLTIFQFLWVWNDLLVALIYLGGDPRVAPLTVTISNLVNSLGGGWELLTAAAFVSMVLPLGVFFGLQRYFVRGILAGAVKG